MFYASVTYLSIPVGRYSVRTTVYCLARYLIYMDKTRQLYTWGSVGI